MDLIENKPKVRHEDIIEPLLNAAKTLRGLEDEEEKKCDIREVIVKLKPISDSTLIFMKGRLAQPFNVMI